METTLEEMDAALFVRPKEDGLAQLLFLTLVLQSVEMGFWEEMKFVTMQMQEDVLDVLPTLLDGHVTLLEPLATPSVEMESS
jgi:hypothetical protein